MNGLKYLWDWDWEFVVFEWFCVWWFWVLGVLVFWVVVVLDWDCFRVLVEEVEVVGEVGILGLFLWGVWKVVEVVVDVLLFVDGVFEV